MTRHLYDINKSNQGIEKMTHLARAHVYWSGIDADIIEYVRHSTICTRHKASQTVQPTLPRVSHQLFYIFSSLTHLVNTHSYTEFISRPLTAYPMPTGPIFPI